MSTAACSPCQTGGWGLSLWASAEQRKAWEAGLCPEHAAKLKAERDAWAAAGDAFTEMMKDPVKKAAWQEKVREKMKEGEAAARKLHKEMRRTTHCDCHCCRRY